MRNSCLPAFFALAISAMAYGQAVPDGGSPAVAPPVIALKDALERAKRYGGQMQIAALAAALAHEDRAQARAALLPSLNALNQFIYTEGNGTSSGVFVSADGVHVYNEQAVLHQELLSVYRRADLRRARAAEAAAIARRDIALRGLNATVVQNFYAVVAAVRKIENARNSLADAEHFLQITQKQESGGEAARADVIKARLQQLQRQRDLNDAQLALEKAKIALAVLIFADSAQDFAASDDLESTPAADDRGMLQGQAIAASPDVRASQASLLQARQETAVARYGYLPSLSLDFFYGINANQFASTSDLAPESGRSTLPDYLVENRHNLGYSAQITLNVPIWNWGSTRSKVKQAELRENQAAYDAALTRKQVTAAIDSALLEARAAQRQIESLRAGAELSAESLRLTLLRYQAGEATVLEVVDAQSTLASARNAYADGLARYRVASALVEIATGRL